MALRNEKSSSNFGSAHIEKPYFILHLLSQVSVLLFQWNDINIRIRLQLVKLLMIKISEISLTQRFDDSMSSFSSEKNKKVKILQLNIYRERR